MARGFRSAYGSFLRFFARSGADGNGNKGSRAVEAADQRVSVSEGRKRAFPGDAL